MKWGKTTKSKNPKDAARNKGRIMLLSKCAVSNSKKPKFIKKQEASRLFTSLGIKTPLSKISLVGPLLFYRY